jgi:hypothetical protein
VPIGRSIRISEANGRSAAGSAPINPLRSLSVTVSVGEVTGPRVSLVERLC